MQGQVSRRVDVVVERRNFGDPRRRPALLCQAEILAGFQPQRTHEVGHFAVAARAEEHDVAIACAHVLQQRGEGVFAKELLDRRTDRAGLVDLDVGQALGTCLLYTSRCV